MTLEITVSEVISVADIFGGFLEKLKNIITKVINLVDVHKSPDVEDEMSNKSPPLLDIYVSDNSDTGESFGP